MIITFFNNLRQKTIDLFNTLISKIPNNLKILANVLTFILYIPITILGIFSMIILTISSAFKFRLPGNIGGIIGTVIGVIIGLILSIFVVAIKFIFELIGLLLLPFLNKFSDSIIDKPYIRKMVIGNFMDNGKFDEGIVLSKNMVNTLDFEVKKNLLGKESLYVVINEGFEKMSLTDRILNLFLPNYFVNKKTIFVTDKSNKESFENLFKNSKDFSDKDGNLNIYKILESIEKIDIELIKILKNDDRAKKHFFTQIDDIHVLNQNKLIEFFTLNDYMKNGSYTSYTNKIGLIKKDNFIKKFDDVVLAFPHKDCVLEGGQTKDDDKKKEVFYNEILSSDEIDRLFEPKVLTNIKRYSKDGAEENCEIKNDDNLIIKGNNLIALHSLKKKYAGKVKLIYIDPPYNTGNDSFKYNDNFNHSTWLTFMKNRLEVAKDFLSDYGVIFVQCDDNEQAYLKVLMDEIFHKEDRKSVV